MKHESFDEWMRQKVNAHEAPVPADAWEKIAGKKKKRRRVLVWWWIPLLAGILALGYATYHYPDPSQGEKRIAKGEQGKAGQRSDKQEGAEMVTIENGNYQDEKNTDRRQQPAGITTVPATGKIALADKTTRKKAITLFLSTKQNKDAVAPDAMQMKKAAGDKIKDTGVAQLTVADDSSKTAVEEKGITLKEWTIDSVYLQPENAVPAVAKAKRQRKYFADLYVMPFVPFQQVTQNNVSRVQENPGMKNEFVSSDIRSKPQMGWGGGINLGKQLNARWQVMAGLQYATFGEKIWMEGREVITHYNIVQRLENQPGGPVLVTDTVETYQYGRRRIEAENWYQTWSIPVVAGYGLMNTRRMSLQLQGGVVYHIIRQYRNNILGEFEVENAGKLGRSSVAQGLDLQAGMRFVLYPRSRVRVFAEPSIRYGIVPTQTDNMFERKRLHQAGLSVGLQYGF